MADVFSTAMSGRCKDRPELADTPVPLSIAIYAAPVSGDGELAQRLFRPLGYDVSVEPSQRFTGSLLQPERPSGVLTIRQEIPLHRALEHVYVLVPVLDNRKHYWVGADEVTKLLDRAGDWLPAHPERDLITRRYLRYSRRLTREALERLAELDSLVTEDEENEPEESAAPERTERLVDARVRAITEALEKTGARRVLDLGCGEGRLLAHLLKETRIPEILGVDASSRSLEIASGRLRLDAAFPERGRVRLIHGALTYADRRLQGYDAAVAMEVVEHIEPDRLETFERAVFEVATPNTVIVTTPNREYNVVYAGIESDRLRHPDHRFEFTRDEFSEWCDRVSSRQGYKVTVSGVGEEHAEFGSPTQMAVFTK
jgi:3' terminal RNA ribose 2'-O-methyltransferase Hen1